MKVSLFSFILLFIIQSSYALTLDEWKSLDPMEKYDLIDSGKLTSKEIEFEALTDESLIASLKAMKNSVIDSVGTESIDNDVWNMEIIFTIGAIEIGTVEKFYVENSLVAINIWLYQAGGASSNQERTEIKHFNSEAEAIAAGMDIYADVSWQVVSSFEVNEHDFSEILIDHWDQGGFSWTGW